MSHLLWLLRRLMHSRHYDTKLPHDDEDEGKPASCLYITFRVSPECDLTTVNRTKYRWIAEGLGAILDEAFAVKPPSYATTLK